MARGINKVIIVGNLGADPDTKSMPSGNMVANFSVATSESWNDRDTGERQEKTEWHRVVFFGRLAEIDDQYLRKGSQVYVEGKLQTRKWEDRDGNERWTTEIVGNQLEMLGEWMFQYDISTPKRDRVMEKLIFDKTKSIASDKKHKHSHHKHSDHKHSGHDH